VVLVIKNCGNEQSPSTETQEISTKSERPTSKQSVTTNDEAQPENLSEEEKVNAWNKLFKKPINFWVKVIDENENPIEGATVVVKVFRDSGLGIASNQVVSLTTNNQGLAEMRKKSGAMVHARAMADGYVEYRDPNGSYDLSRKNINYTTSSNEFNIIPTSSNPTILRLRKTLPEAELVEFKSKRLDISKTGEESTITAQIADINEAITMKVKCWSEAPKPFDYSRYPWKAEIRVEGGQILNASDEYGYEAPQDGYLDMFKIDHLDPESKDWLRSCSGRRGYFWIKLNSGKFAKVSLDLDTGFNHRFSFKGYLNMDGTKALDVQF